MNLLIHDTANISKTVKFLGKGKIIIGAFVSLEDGVQLDTGNNVDSYIEIQNRAKVKTGTLLKTYNGSISIGKRTTIGPYCCIAGHGGVTIGENVLIANHCSIHASMHIYSNKEDIRYQGEIAKGIVIGSNCWIGTHVSIIDAVEIMQGCIVGAGSVVINSLSENSICVGVPCKKIKNRS